MPVFPNMQTSFHLFAAAAAISSVIPLAGAQFPPPLSNLTVIKSKVDPRVKISFKEAEVCRRGCQSKTYSGFVHLPGSSLADVGGFDVNSYFLYFEARNNPSTAPLGIYLAGGPGESSTYAALSSESGPCYVNSEGTDTIDNPWSFNNNVNMLYIDQPVDAGFSYSGLINGTFNLLAGDGLITPINFDHSAPPPVNSSFGYGTYPDQQFRSTQNNTVQAAKTLWHFAEHWLSSFPGYSTGSKQISIWGNSYGGYWVPETAAQFSKSLKSLPAQHPLKKKDLAIDAIGITNGCIDFTTSALGYPEYAYNNTYDVRYASKAEYDSAVHNFTMPGGCRDLIEQCRSLAQQKDPTDSGGVAEVNELCMGAFGFCAQYVIGGFPKMNEHSAFDIAENGNPPPCDFWLPVLRYLNKAKTQQALGVPLNFTYDSNVVTQNFGLPSAYIGLYPPSASTGDSARQNGLPNIEYLLANNVKVAFIYGDRDYRCPWTGAESTALAAKWAGRRAFANAGYEVMQGVKTPVNQGGLRALVKQHGQFSFARVIDSGHAVSAYAPETVYRIFQRTIQGRDVVTGAKVVGDAYSTNGPRTSWGWRNNLPASPPTTCMVGGRFTSTNPWNELV